MINKGIDDESLPLARLVFAYRRLQPHYEFTRRKRVETFKGWSLASTFKSNRSVIKLLRELTFWRDRAIASRNRALFPPTLPFPAVRVSRNKISSCCLLSPLSLSRTHAHTCSLSLSLTRIGFTGQTRARAERAPLQRKITVSRSHGKSMLFLSPTREPFFAFSSIARAESKFHRRYRGQWRDGRS